MIRRPLGHTALTVQTALTALAALTACQKAAPAPQTVAVQATETPAVAAPSPAVAAPEAVAVVAPPKPAEPPDPACPPGGKLEVADGVKVCLRNGAPDGPEVRWDPETGFILQELRWKAGKKSGPARYFTPGGQVRMETTYKDDLEEGLHRHFAAGRLVWEGENHAGKAEGKWTYYRATDGSLDRVECQVDGKAMWNVRDQAEADAKKCPP